MLSVIRNGYVPQLAENPRKYEEPNNMSYKNGRDWAKTAVGKLKDAKLVAEVSREDLWCVHRVNLGSAAGDREGGVHVFI